jgi:hypothetical protein
MSTTTPTTGTRTDADTDIDTETAAADVGTTGDRPGPGTTGTGRPDRWAAGEGARDGSAAAPLTFDPFCTRRLRSCIDGANAAFPDSS